MTAELEQYEKHHDPLPALRQALAEEFEGIVPKDRIDEAAERAIGDFKGARSELSSRSSPGVEHAHPSRRSPTRASGHAPRPDRADRPVTFGRSLPAQALRVKKSLV
jgi:hypothetical protein